MGAVHHKSKGPGGPVKVVTPDKTRLYEFHGHLGPYVVLGFRAARLACKLLHSPGYFDMSCEVTSPLSPPHSCFIDGIQVGSGCTLGKNNLKVKEGESISCVFRTKEGSSLTLILKKDFPLQIKKWIEKEGVEGAGERAWKIALEKVFEIKK